MITLPRTFGLALVAAATLSLSACDSGRPAPLAQPAAPETTTPAGKVVEPPTAAQRAEIEGVFNEARALVAEARKHREAGEAAGRAGNGISDAIPHYQQARPLYREASQLVEPWVVEDFGLLTRDQIDEFMRPEEAELGKWIKENSKMGKFPPKD